MKLSGPATGALILSQGFFSILNFVFLLVLLADGNPWFTWTNADGSNGSLSKDSIDYVSNMLVASVVLSTLSLLLLIFPERIYRDSFRMSKFGFVLTTASMILLATSVGLLLSHVNSVQNITALSNQDSYKYLASSLGLNVGSFVLFIFILIFGTDPQFSKYSRKLLVSLILISFFIFFGGLIFWKMEGWEYSQAIMFCLVTMATIGYGNNVPTYTASRCVTIIFAIGGIAVLGMLLNQIRENLIDRLTESVETEFYKAYDRAEQKFHWKHKEWPVTTEKQKTRDRRIAAFCLVVIWWLVGAAIFMALEGWSYFDSFYFCFITLATIGYGDFVPQNPNSVSFLIIYVLTGLSIFALFVSSLADSTAEVEQQIERLKEIFDNSNMTDRLQEFAKKRFGSTQEPEMSPLERAMSAPALTAPEESTHISSPSPLLTASSTPAPHAHHVYQSRFFIKNVPLFKAKTEEMIDLVKQLPDCEKPKFDEILEKYLFARDELEDLVAVSAAQGKHHARSHNAAHGTTTGSMNKKKGGSFRGHSNQEAKEGAEMEKVSEIKIVVEVQGQ